MVDQVRLYDNRINPNPDTYELVSWEDFIPSRGGLIDNGDVGSLVYWTRERVPLAIPLIGKFISREEVRFHGTLDCFMVPDLREWYNYIIEEQGDNLDAIGIYNSGKYLDGSQREFLGRHHILHH